MVHGKRLRFCCRIRMLFYAFGVVALICAICVWEPWKAQRFRRSASHAYNAISDDLEKEIQSSRNGGWNGTYFANRKDGVMLTITIARNSDWIFESIDSNGSYDRNFGHFYLSDDDTVIHLEPTFPSEYLPTAIYPLKQGEFSFLIGKNELDEFRVSSALGEKWLSSQQSEFLIRRELIDGEETIPSRKD